MAGWNNATMTDAGEILQTKVNAGLTKLTFTKIKVGSGVSTTNAQALTDVIASKWETTNFTVKRDGKIVTVDTFITNTGITEAFRMAEIGLFAQDPDKGEVLYAYLTDSEPDRMPAEGGSTVVSQELSLGMTFSNSGNVTLTVNMGALVTREQLEQHNSDPNAHGNRFNAIIQQVNNMITNVDNNDVLAKAPTLQLVKNLLSGLNIKNATDVVNALESEKATGLGIRYDFSNENAWYICFGKLFGNLIIQGGINADGKGWTDQNSDSRTGRVKFGITFNTKPIIVLPTCRIKSSTTEEPIVVNVIHTSLNRTGFEYNADEVGGGYQSRILEYIAIGI